MIADLDHLSSVIPGAEVSSDELFNSGFLRNTSGVLHGGMLSFASHIDLIRTESGFMDERGTCFGQPDRAFGKLRIQAICHGFARARRPDDHVRRNDATVLE